MKMNRNLSYLFVIISFAAPAFINVAYIRYLGFPDGYVTELEKAGRTLYYVFLCLSPVFGALFFYLGLSAVKQKSGRPLLISIVVYIATCAALILVYSALGLFLDNGRGG
jgi:uncharacterized membrane protein